jgi:hypothetical protein
MTNPAIDPWPTPPVTDFAEVIRNLQQSAQRTDLRLCQVEEAGKFFGETQRLMDEKLDNICRMLVQANLSSEPSSVRKSPPLTTSPNDPQTLSVKKMAFLRKQEAAGKFSLFQEPFPKTDKPNLGASTSTTPTFTFHPPNNHTQQGFGYINQIPEPSTRLQLPNQNPSHQSQEPQKLHPHNTTQATVTHNQFNPTNHLFSLSIARPKLDFTTFLGDESINWLRQCEKYFALTSVPMDTWVPLATLHCHGMTQTWWRSLRTPANYVQWTQFCTMVYNRFSPHSLHSSMEHFPHLKQNSSIIEYIQRFEELMALMQMDYPGLSEHYFMSSFIAGLKEDIKHYLIPHSPQTLSDTYW